MTRASQTHLIPAAEMTPGMVASIRNSVISQLVALAAKELSMPEEQLIVRDIEPYTDLSWDYGAASAGAAESWERDLTGTTVGYVDITSTTMGDQRYIAIFGVRDLRISLGATSTATELTHGIGIQPVSLVKFTIGGAVKAIWDITSVGANMDNPVGFAPGAVIIPQNAAFVVSFYQKNVAAVATAKSVPAYLQLIGVTVEPRGKVISP